VDICADHGIEFIGPKSYQINLMGDKNSARETMKVGPGCLKGGCGAARGHQSSAAIIKAAGLLDSLRRLVCLVPIRSILVP